MADTLLTKTFRSADGDDPGDLAANGKGKAVDAHADSADAKKRAD
jgi:hypothetical protein